jgi:hypothetical protein
MKTTLIITAAIILHLNTFAQLFDGTLDGARPGRATDVVAHYEKKGYNVVKDVKYPPDQIFLLGFIKPDPSDDKRCSVLLHLSKDEKTDSIYYLSANFLPQLAMDFDDHIKKFTKKFGTPKISENKKSAWQLGEYSYVIKVDGEGVLMHELRLEKM